MLCPILLATKRGLEIRKDGYVRLKDVLQLLRLTEERVNFLVTKSDKQRFELTTEGGVTFIRATQGHTIKAVESEELLQEIKDASAYGSIIHGSH